jgi:glucuronoxylan 4-O-methyltransferase
MNILRTAMRTCILAYQRWKLHIQMGVSELFEITGAITPPVRFLVFGLGNDSVFWHSKNKDGRTVFIEDDPSWHATITQRHPFLETYLVNYGTRRTEWAQLLNSPEKLTIDLPPSITNTAWDVILVDAPAGYEDRSPGRMKSIYMASVLVKNGGDVFVHDAERDIEREYASKYMGDGEIAGKIRSTQLLKRFRVTKNVTADSGSIIT